MWVKSKNTTYMWVKSKNTTYMWAKSKNTTSCMQQNASTECKSATKANQLYKAFLVTGTAFCIWKLELFCTRLKRNQIFAEQ